MGDRRAPHRKTGWSDAQRRVFLRACNAAGWNDQMRYMVMRHVGCPNEQGKDRPSVKHAGNRQSHYEAAMAIAEAHAAEKGATVPKPRNADSWRTVGNGNRKRLISLATRIAHEGYARLPGVFNQDALEWAVGRTSSDDAVKVTLTGPPSKLEECDEGQLIRVVELLRAVVGRKLDERNMKPETFSLPASVIRRRKSRSASAAG